MSKKKLHYKTYYDKVLGGWIGKCAGGILGAPIEGFKCFNEIELSDKLFETNFSNDDLDLQILWLDMVKKKGALVNEFDLREHWINHVLSLRTSLGLRNDKIFPFDYWLIRNQGIWNEPHNFFYSTISELLAYIKYYYEEAIEKLKIRLEGAKKCFENYEILNYTKLSNSVFSKRNNVTAWKHPLKDDGKFHDPLRL